MFCSITDWDKGRTMCTCRRPGCLRINLCHSQNRLWWCISATHTTTSSGSMEQSIRIPLFLPPIKSARKETADYGWRHPNQFCLNKVQRMINFEQRKHYLSVVDHKFFTIQSVKSWHNGIVPSPLQTGQVGRLTWFNQKKTRCCSHHITSQDLHPAVVFRSSGKRFSWTPPGIFSWWLGVKFQAVASVSWASGRLSRKLGWFVGCRTKSNWLSDPWTGSWSLHHSKYQSAQSSVRFSSCTSAW